MEARLMTLSIVEFLLARLQEDDDTARAATAGPWHDDGGCVSNADYQITDYGAYTQANGEPEEWEERQQRADSAHIARHDPARVLREVAAKRRIMERHSLSGATKFTAYCAGGHYDSDGFPEVELEDCPELRDLAAIYSAHPSYREEWKP
jgi:hypothetical protein